MKPSQHVATSRLLQNVADSVGDQLTIGTLAHQVGDRAFGIMMLVFALPNAIPVPMPGVSTILAIPLLFFSIQLMLGRDEVWLPRWLANKPIQGETMRRVLAYSIPWVARIEKLFKPRLDRFTGDRAKSVAGLLVTLLAALIALPIPFGNMVPAVAMCLVCLALIEHDGVFMVIGWISCLLGMVYVYLLVTGYAWVAQRIYESIFSVSPI